MPSWAAATVIAALPRKRRRSLVISTDIYFAPPRIHADALWPRWRNAWTTAAPMPREAPVTMTASLSAMPALRSGRASGKTAVCAFESTTTNSSRNQLHANIFHGRPQEFEELHAFLWKKFGLCQFMNDAGELGLVAFG
jgi:hypothetical protein